MKRLIFIFFLGAFLFANAQPKITFKKTDHEFGNIKEEKGIATAVFDFKNTGNQPLIVNNVKASCGCTTPEWDKEPIAPGKSGTIKVAYNPQNRPGAFMKSINVYSNTDPSVTNLTIKGNVEPRELTVEEKFPRVMGGLRFKSNYISLGTVFNDQTKSDSVEYYNSSDKPVKVGIYRSPSHVVIRFVPETVKPGEYGKMYIKYDASQRNAYGYVSDRIYLNVDDKNDNEYSVGISLSISEDFSKLTEEQKANAPVAVVENNVYDFGVLVEGDVAEYSYKIKNTGKSDLLIRNVKASCGCTAVKHSNLVKPGETTDINVKFNSRGKKGRQNKSVTVITNDPNNSTITFRITGDVKAKTE
ncbi:MAG: DUF1573 domain-containing protein [Prolixibacteraceae bacterium]|nr:DUF1573 domain-containing protein [Prolixibacteraceae bacterium]